MEAKHFYSFGDEVADLLSPYEGEDARLVQKGLMLYRQGLVSHLHMGTDQVTGTVQDVMPVKVCLDFNFLAMSECSCPAEGICRHKLAVFFAAYSRFDSVSDWVAEWREPAREKKVFSSWGLQTAKDLVKTTGARNMQPDYSRWVQSFEVSFDTLLASKKYTSPYVIPELFAIYQRQIQASAPAKEEWRFMYDLVAAVVSFRKLAALSEKLGHEEDIVHRTYLHLFQHLLDDGAELLDKINGRSLPFAIDEFIEKLRADAFELLTCASGLEYERIYLYRLLWTQLFKKKSWREEEAEKVHVRGKELQDWENPLPLAVARIHLNFLLQNDELALKMMAPIVDEMFTPYLVYWIEYLSGLRAWRRVGPVIELFLQKVKAYLESLGSYYSCTSFVRTALRAVTPYCSENDRVDVYERAMLQTLPYCFGEYEYFLFERGQYDRWGELQAFIGLDFYELPKDRLKVIEKERPELLLSMLHQTAQREIDQKNRSGYVQAVRHLKKLRTLYKKLKRADDWQYFLDTLMERTKRLRAFHEECRRSKLIEG